MEEIIRDIQSPAWWFAVVMVGIAVNVLSHYVDEQTFCQRIAKACGESSTHNVDDFTNTD